MNPKKTIAPKRVSAEYRSDVGVGERREPVKHDRPVAEFSPHLDGGLCPAAVLKAHRAAELEGKELHPRPRWGVGDPGPG